jgi:UDP-N-acetylmuramate: L-alanyl-gamma-D-glutamyl-meso-diaminopimelate ligase
VSEAPRHVHFVAIGGTGMGSFAGLLHARGVRVTGSDEKLYPPMSTLLGQWGIPVMQGFRAENVLEHPPDLVVIGNAVRASNPEARAAIDEGLAYRSFPDALYELAIAGKHSVVISGTHGKTTTTSLVAALLHGTGRDPSLLVGGHSLDFGGSFREGQGEHFVVEGDEYDTAFFDKTPKFLHYGARTLVITSVEFDHADIYRDLEHVKQSFRTLVSRLPSDGTLIAAIDHEGVRDVIAEAPCRVVGYGLEARGAGSWRASGIKADAEGTRFDVSLGGRFTARVRVPLFGRVNVENALAALATVDPGRRLVAVFEPRTNTSRRRVFQRDYAEAFEGAGWAVIAVVPDTPIYSITGEVTERFSAEELASDLRTRGIPADAIEGVPAIVERLARDCRSGDVVIVMSNGDFGNLWQHLLEALRG